MLYINEKSIKNTTEQCSLEKQAMFGSCANVPKLRSLRFLDYVIQYSPSVMFRLNCPSKSVSKNLVPPYDIHQ